MSKQVIILGGGVIGLFTAFECLQRGHKVTVIERKPSQRDGCSYGNAGLVVPSHFVPLAAPGMVALGLKWMWNPESPFYIKPRLNLDLMGWAWRFMQACTQQHVEASAPLLRDLNLASRESYVRLAEKHTAFGLQQKGLLMLCKTAKALEHEAHAAEQAHAIGLEAKVLNRSETAALEPHATLDVAGSVFFPGDCHLQPQRLIAMLEQAIRDGGGTLLFETEVTGWKRKGSALTAVVTNQGEIAGDEFVLCGGSWSPEMLKGLNLRLPMQAGKGYSLTMQNPVELPATSLILVEARIAITPMGQTLRFGGTMEIAGLDESITQRRVKGIVKAVPNYLPKFTASQFADIKPWSGLRPCSPDGLPYIGRTKAAPNLVIATGHAMMGLSLAPVTGEIVSDLVSDQKPRFAMTLLSPDRYA